MSIVLTVATTDVRSWAFSWTGGVGPFGIWLDGDLLETTSARSYAFDGAGYEAAPPDLEVVDVSATPSNETFPPRALLQWRGLLAANAYVVEQFLAGAWTVVASVDEAGAGYYSWRSATLDDAATAQFRVSAADVDGGKGASLPFTFSVVRNPAHPTVAVAGSSGTVIVS